MNRWHWGADGIYLFNLFPSNPDERFSQLGSVETLKGRDKIYAMARLPVGEDIIANTPSGNRLMLKDNKPVERVMASPRW